MRFIVGPRNKQLLRNLLSSFMASVATQVQAAMQVGVPVDDTPEARRTDECETTLRPAEVHGCDALGCMTRNGRGSLEISAGKTRIDE